MGASTTRRGSRGDWAPGRWWPGAAAKDARRAPRIRALVHLQVRVLRRPRGRRTEAAAAAANAAIAAAAAAKDAADAAAAKSAAARRRAAHHHRPAGANARQRRWRPPIAATEQAAARAGRRDRGKGHVHAAARRPAVARRRQRVPPATRNAKARPDVARGGVDAAPGLRLRRIPATAAAAATTGGRVIQHKTTAAARNGPAHPRHRRNVVRAVRDDARRQGHPSLRDAQPRLLLGGTRRGPPGIAPYGPSEASDIMPTPSMPGPPRPPPMLIEASGPGIALE